MWWCLFFLPLVRAQIFSYNYTNIVTQTSHTCNNDDKGWITSTFGSIDSIDADCVSHYVRTDDTCYMQQDNGDLREGYPITCGTGSTWAEINITVLGSGSGIKCPPSRIKNFPCDTNLTCPVDCVLSHWVDVSNCTATCNGGTKIQNRSIVVEPMYNGTACGNLTRTTTCNTQACPIDCVLSPWYNTSECSVSCGNGTQAQHRDIVTLPNVYGQSCGETERVEPCNEHVCVDCQVTPFIEGVCDKQCGTGSIRVETRQLLQNATDQGSCDYVMNRSFPCNVETCDVFCADACSSGSYAKQCNETTLICETCPPCTNFGTQRVGCTGTSAGSCECSSEYLQFLDINDEVVCLTNPYSDDRAEAWLTNSYNGFFTFINGNSTFWRGRSYSDPPGYWINGPANNVVVYRTTSQPTTLSGAPLPMYDATEQVENIKYGVHDANGWIFTTGLVKDDYILVDGWPHLITCPSGWYNGGVLSKQNSRRLKITERVGTMVYEWYEWRRREDYICSPCVDCNSAEEFRAPWMPPRASHTRYGCGTREGAGICVPQGKSLNDPSVVHAARAANKYVTRMRDTMQSSGLNAFLGLVGEVAALDDALTDQEKLAQGYRRRLPKQIFTALSDVQDLVKVRAAMAQFMNDVNSSDPMNIGVSTAALQRSGNLTTYLNDRNVSEVTLRTARVKTNESCAEADVHMERIATGEFFEVVLMEEGDTSIKCLNDALVSKLVFTNETADAFEAFCYENSTWVSQGEKRAGDSYQCVGSGAYLHWVASDAGVQPIPGCTNASAVNYNANATTDDNSCLECTADGDCASGTCHQGKCTSACDACADECFVDASGNVTCVSRAEFCARTKSAYASLGCDNMCYVNGACETRRAAYVSKCSTCDCVCTMQYDPVCCDGETFSNSCMAACAGKSSCIANAC